MHTAIFPIKFKGFSKFFTILGLITSTAFTKSCTSVPIEATKLSRQWFLVEFENYPKEFFSENKIQLDLSPTKNHPNFSSFDGCNRLYFNAQTKNRSEIKFTDFRTGTIFCSGSFGEEFQQFLRQAKTYKTEGHTLILYDGNGRAMKFVAADWD
ncbi:META domain-containing protein [Cruoricaptor ignavus]|uniref:META domain-containing protein n=1 Tax=Cruoricaptor ignavus TaxID=1118202 RepID=A0A7M1T2H4_9FLAO|nr:META domain-containing protein [Cruoricaptor ignavus]QOR73142.1 META domain-containing protein [Cruoricaptor ignavus]